MICPGDNILEEVSKRFRLEVGEEAILLHLITCALDSLLEDVTLLNTASNVVVGSSFSRKLACFSDNQKEITTRFSDQVKAN